MTYTVQEGKHAASPRIFRPGIDRTPWAVWRIELLEGWDYVLPTNQTQWVKLCGLAFGFSANRNTILLGARHIQGTGVQIAPYYNVRGEQWYKEKAPAQYADSWPVIPVDTNYSITFALSVAGSEVITTMINNGMRQVHKIDHTGLCMLYREVNFYFGGSVPASQKISVEKKRLDRITYSPEDGGFIFP